MTAGRHVGQLLSAHAGPHWQARQAVLCRVDTVYVHSISTVVCHASNLVQMNPQQHAANGAHKNPLPASSCTSTPCTTFHPQQNWGPGPPGVMVAQSFSVPPAHLPPPIDTERGAWSTPAGTCVTSRPIAGRCTRSQLPRRFLWPVCAWLRLHASHAPPCRTSHIVWSQHDAPGPTSWAPQMQT